MKEAKIILGGKEYPIRSSLRVALYFEEMTGKKYLDVLAGGVPSITDMLYLICAMIKNADKSFKLDAWSLSDIIQDGELDVASKILFDLLKENNPSETEIKEPSPLANPQV